MHDEVEVVFRLCVCYGYCSHLNLILNLKLIRQEGEESRGVRVKSRQSKSKEKRDKAGEFY